MRKLSITKLLKASRTQSTSEEVGTATHSYSVDGYVLERTAGVDGEVITVNGKAVAFDVANDETRPHVAIFLYGLPFEIEMVWFYELGKIEFNSMHCDAKGVMSDSFVCNKDLFK